MSGQKPKPKPEKCSPCVAPVCNYKEPVKRNKFNWALLVSTILAVAGWGVVSSLNQRVNAESRRMDEKLKYLISAYDDLVNGSILEAHKRRQESFPRLQSAFVKMQLFGSEEQISLIHEATNALDKGTEMPMVRLINSVRSDLRELMGSEPTQSDIRFLRADTVWIINPVMPKP